MLREAMLIIDALVFLITLFIILYIVVYIRYLINYFKNKKSAQGLDNDDVQDNGDDDLNNPPRRPPPSPRIPPTIIWTVTSTLDKEKEHVFYDYSKVKAILIEELVDDI